MKAIVVDTHGAADVLRVRSDAAVPEPSAGQVSIDVAYAGVNFAETMARRGTHPGFPTPFVPGLEVSGRIRALGEGVSNLIEGQAVCALTTRGGYAEVALAPALLTYKLQSDGRDELLAGAAFPTVGPTAWALIHSVGRLTADEDVLIHAAAGGVGSVAGQMARLAGARCVRGVVSTARKADYAKDFGYDEVYIEQDWAATARRQCAERGIDVVLDSVGGEIRRQSLDLLAPLGRLVMYGNASGATEVGFAGSELRSRCTATLGFSIMSLAASAPRRLRAIASAALDAVTEHQVRIDITEILPLEQAFRAHELLESRASTGKLVLAVQAQ
jgi:NADPH:quinone reductase